MQPQCHEVRVENDEYERAAVPSEANKACGRLEKRPYLRVVRFEKALTFLNSFNIMRTLCLPSHTSHTLLHMHDRPFQKHVPRLLTNPDMLVQMSLRCTRKAYTANMYT